MYQEIIGPNQLNSNVERAYLLSMVKSGSTWLFAFFRIYARLCKEQEIDHKILAELVRSYNDMLQFNSTELMMGYGECPGFDKTLGTTKRFRWNKLCSNMPLTNFTGPNNDTFELFKDSDLNFAHSKIVFVFRNPLDQLLSFFKHGADLPRDDQQGGFNTSTFDEKKFEDFIFAPYGLEYFIKHFYTFHIVRQQYPDAILFVPYEKLMNDKSMTVSRILNHLGLMFNPVAFEHALSITSIENMRQLEDESGCNLKHATKTRSRHIRNGGVGVWQTVMSPELVQRIENKLNEFDLSLNMFYIAYELDAKFDFLKRPTEQHKFRFV